MDDPNENASGGPPDALGTALAGGAEINPDNSTALVPSDKDRNYRRSYENFMQGGDQLPFPIEEYDDLLLGECREPEEVELWGNGPYALRTTIDFTGRNPREIEQLEARCVELGLEVPPPLKDIPIPEKPVILECLAARNHGLFPLPYRRSK